MSACKLVFIGSAGGGVLSKLVQHAFVREMALEAVSDRDCGFLDVAGAAGMAAIKLDARDGGAFSAALHARYRDRDDLVFISFYTRLFAGDFLRKNRGRILNGHPSLLPAFKGLRGFEETLASGCRFMGSTVHVVDEGIDSGAAIIQAALPIDRSLPVAENRHKVFLSQVYATLQTLRWIKEGRLALMPDGFRLAGATFLPATFSPNLDADFFDFIQEDDQLKIY